MPNLPPDEDRQFQHYTMKHRVVAWISMNLFDNFVYTVRHGLLKGKKRRGGLGWMPVSGTETAEHRFWNNLDLSGKTVYDVGAFQGLLALFFASKAKTVICFEPNAQNAKRLMENLALNGIANVQLRRTGVGSKSGTMKMVGDPLMPGGSSVDARIIESLLQSGAGTVIAEIPIATLDEEIPAAKLPPPDLIKIDIEGWEIEALRGARNSLISYKPELFLEMHGETIREKKSKVAEIVTFLWEAGYRRIEHVETGAAITP